MTAHAHTTELTEAEIAALTVAMAVAPGVYARNRNFALFTRPGARYARSRASVLLGLARHLARASGLSVTSETGREDAPVFVLRYRIVEMSLVRVAELSAVELAALRVLAARGGATALPCTDEDRAVVERALATLLDIERLPSVDARLSPGASPDPAHPARERECGARSGLPRLHR